MKKITRKVPRSSHGSVGHCEKSVKDAENQIRATIFQRYAEYRCDSDKVLSELPIFFRLVDMMHGRMHGTNQKLVGRRHSLFFDGEGLIAKRSRSSENRFGFASWPHSQSWQSNVERSTLGRKVRAV